MSDALANLEDLNEEALLDLVAELQLEVDENAYFEKYLKVQPREGGGVVPFKLNGPQKLLSHIFEAIQKDGRLLRVLILKGRRMGVSTYVAGRFYRKVSRKKSCYALLTTHEPAASEFIFKMVKRFHNLSPRQDRPQILANNARLLEFNNADGTGLDSAFRIATAGKDDVGSGQGVHCLPLSECPKFPEANAEGLIKSVLPCVPPEPDTEIIFEGTANGVGGEFYNRFWGAKYRCWISKLDDAGQPVIEFTENEEADPTNDYTSIFLPWFIFEKNRKPLPDFIAARLDGTEHSFTEDEMKIKATFNLDYEQLYWRRFTIANEFKGDKRLFSEAHPDTPESAFLSTGTPSFDNEQLMVLKKAAKPPRARYSCMSSTGVWYANPSGELKVWREPVVGASYIISADVSEGLEDGDFDSADVIDHRTGEQVAQLHGKWEPKEFGKILIALGRRYNVAYLAPERNNHGLTTVTEIVDSGYPRLHVELVAEPPNKPRKRWGWVTSSATRTQIIDNLKSEMIEGCHGINCAETFGEMMSFKRVNGKEQAEVGMKDDRCISIAIGKFLRLRVPIPSRPKPSHIKEGKSGGGNKGGWGGC